MIMLSRLVGNAETVLAGPVTVSGLTYTAGLSLSVRVQVTGTAPTVVRARVWRTGQAEPTAWQVTPPTPRPDCRSAGAVGVGLYGSRSLHQRTGHGRGRRVRPPGRAN